MFSFLVALSVSSLLRYADIGGSLHCSHSSVLPQRSRSGYLRFHELWDILVQKWCRVEGIGWLTPMFAWNEVPTRWSGYGPSSITPGSGASPTSTCSSILTGLGNLAKCTSMSTRMILILGFRYRLPVVYQSPTGLSSPIVLSEPTTKHCCGVPAITRGTPASMYNIPAQKTRGVIAPVEDVPG